MKVLIVHPCKGFYGGAEEVVSQLTRYLILNGHEVQIVTKDAPKEFFGHLFVGQIQPAVYDWGSWRMMRWWTQKLMDWADVINVHNFPATLATFPTKKPTVYMCNEPAELFTNWRRKPIEAFNRWWVKKSGMKVVVADELNAFRFYKIYGVEPTIIPYGVDYGFWSNIVRNRAMFTHQPTDRTRLLQIGTISYYKNQLESILALAELVADGIDASLTLVGGITEKDYYKDIADKIDYIDKEEIENFSKRITFMWQRVKEDIRVYYGSHDVLLHPVREQGGWLVPFEAICAGLPVITTPSFTASSIIEKNRLGIVTSDLECGIRRIIEGNRVDTEKAKEWVRENLTWEKFGEGMVKAFKEALNGE